jgi:HPr kinase/phosphorylase
MSWRFPNESILKKRNLLVREILEESSIQIHFELITSKITSENVIQSKSLYRPQFILAGFEDSSDNKQILVFGTEEIEYLNSLTEEQKISSIEKIITRQAKCIIITNGLELQANLLEKINIAGIAILSTTSDLLNVFDVLTGFLNDHFSPQMVVHSTFTDVHGVGILFVGKSSIGKSEVALDLVERGHRLVADDTVMLTNNAEGTIMGTSTKIAKHFMEIRGLGIIDVRAMFGVRAVRFQKRVEMIVELEEYNNDNEYTRTGLEESTTEVMGVTLDFVKLPINPGKNITVIVEAIALNYLLRTYGYNPAKVMTDNLHSMLTNEPVHEDKFKTQRLINYFQGDRE